MVDAKRTAALMQVIHVLRAQIKTVAQLLLDLCQGHVRGIRLGPERVAAAHGIEPPHQFGIRVPGLGRCNLIHPISVPQPPGPRKVASPLSAEIPAPVSTKNRSCEVRIMARLSRLISCRDVCRHRSSSCRHSAGRFVFASSTGGIVARHTAGTFFICFANTR